MVWSLKCLKYRNDIWIVTKVQGFYFKIFRRIVSCSNEMKFSGEILLYFIFIPSNVKGKIWWFGQLNSTLSRSVQTSYKIGLCTILLELGWASHLQNSWNSPFWVLNMSRIPHKNFRAKDFIWLGNYKQNNNLVKTIMFLDSMELFCVQLK